MSNPTNASTTISNIGVAMFTIADQDAAIAYYTQTLGWELRADIPFGDEGANRWVEVAPPGWTDDDGRRRPGAADVLHRGSRRQPHLGRAVRLRRHPRHVSVGAPGMAS